MSKGPVDVLWGKAFTWVISGAALEDVWRITLLKSSELVQGEPQKPGCVTLYPSSPSKPYTVGLEKLLLMDQASHQYIYTIIGGDLPGFSLLDEYVSSISLSSLTASTEHAPSSLLSRMHGPPSLISDQGSSYVHATASNMSILPTDDTTLLHWSFTCRSVSTLVEHDAQSIAFALYKTAVNDMTQHLNLPENSITLLP